MNLLNEDAPRQLIVQVVQEERPTLEEEITGRTIGMDEFRRKYCGGKAAEWVRTFIFDRYPETNYANGGWCVNPHRTENGHKTIIFERKAARWMDDHQEVIDWNEKLKG